MNKYFSYCIGSNGRFYYGCERRDGCSGSCDLSEGGDKKEMGGVERSCSSIEEEGLMSSEN
ncbi:hypothetical protein K8R30_03880 [archaeon]|nr:hypothetical protein [archaeon]